MILSRGLARPSAPALGALLLAAALLAGCAPEPAPAPTPTATPSAAPSPSASPEPEPEFDRAAHSIDDPNSIWVIVNKRRPFQPLDYAPADLIIPDAVENEFGQPLREPAARAAERLTAAAAAAGTPVRVISAYRDYGTQVSLYQRYVDRDGQAAADTYSARPGHSEHQTGLVADFDDGGACYLETCFAETPAGRWLGEHAHEFGFVLRYPAGQDAVTGFMHEPWHFRFVGEELAAEMARGEAATLEEFFGLPAAPDYGP